jgi:hypothetical protein
MLSPFRSVDDAERDMRAGADAIGAIGLRFRRVDALAPLAWCMEMRRGQRDAVVVHGPMVETAPTAFFEGAWDGPFREFGAADACTTMGSGGTVAGDVIHFVAPSHTYEPLVTTADDDRLWVSNSIALALAASADGPDLSYPWYHRDLLGLQRHGITGEHPLSLPTRRGRRLCLHAATDLAVSADLTLRARPRPQPPAPSDFAEYRALLAGTVAALVRNATDDARDRPLAVATTTSTGYDSTASTVLAAEAGVGTSITFDRDRHGVPADCGRALAEQLGLHVDVYDTGAWRRSPDSVIAEFVAGTSGWAMLPMAAFAPDRSGSLVFLGTLGDELWRRDRADIGDALARPRDEEPAPAGLREFRLRAGIVFAHVPTIGAVHAPRIHQLGRSPEMEPWTLHNEYDRPIPRRIVEEAGVPRTAFGQTSWNTIDTQTPEIFARLRAAGFGTCVHESSRQLPRRRAWRLRAEWAWGDRALRAVADHATTWWGRGHRYGLRPVARAGRFVATGIDRWQWHRSLPTLYTFHWGTEELTRRYRDQLATGAADAV